MATRTAADLPDGSVVATAQNAFIKNHPTVYSPWRGTHGGYLGNALVDEMLDAGEAEVLRVGDGREET